MGVNMKNYIFCLICVIGLVFCGFVGVARVKIRVIVDRNPKEAVSYLRRALLDLGAVRDVEGGEEWFILDKYKITMRVEEDVIIDAAVVVPGGCARSDSKSRVERFVTSVIRDAERSGGIPMRVEVINK